MRLLLIIGLVFSALGCGSTDTKQGNNANSTKNSVWPKKVSGRVAQKVENICVMDTGLTKYIFRDSSTSLTFSNDAQATAFGKQIEDLSGPDGNIIFSSDNSGRVINAEADIIDGIRYVIYNNNYMNFAVAQTGYTDEQWGSISILAHEVGHHFFAHQKSKDPKELQKHELQADEHSGWCMCRLGATENQATLAIEKLTSEGGDFSHPGKVQRKASILKGYAEAKAKFGGCIGFVMKDAFSKCIYAKNPVACRQCASQSSAECNRLIQSGATINGAPSDTCQKAPLYSNLALAVEMANSYAAIRHYLEAQEKDEEADAIIKKLKPHTEIAAPVIIPDTCVVLKNGKKWNACNAKSFEEEAYLNLEKGDLNKAKLSFGASYSSYPWLHVVDEMYRKVLTNERMKLYNGADSKGKLMIVKDVYQEIANNEIYRSNTPKNHRQKIMEFVSK